MEHLIHDDVFDPSASDRPKSQASVMHASDRPKSQGSVMHASDRPKSPRVCNACF